jgi:hypothetical protein
MKIRNRASNATEVILNHANASARFFIETESHDCPAQVFVNSERDIVLNPEVAGYYFRIIVQFISELKYN